ncbi:hypothetical protein ACFCXT_06425 [Streptomyces vinaceus]|uniref:hypothetical protein n=1 Tax=Streptomyces vinaceus TaxID=1960 RepID=UPI0035E20E89
MGGTRRRPARGEGTAWAGELRALWTAPVWGATAAVILLALALVGRLWMAGASYGVLDPSVSALTSLPSALRAAAWQFATLLGLVLTGVVVATGLGQTLESGTWSALRLFENRVGVLWARKAGAALVLSLASQIVTGVLLWLSTSAYARLWPVRPRAVPSGFPGGVVHTAPPLPPESATWGQAAGAVAAALLVQLLFISLAALAAALLRSVIGTLALGIGPLLVTAPLVLLPAAPFLPHRWIADLLNLPPEAQYQLYLWNQAPPDPAPLTGCIALAAAAALASAAAWAALRSERALRPVD